MLNISIWDHIWSKRESFIWLGLFFYLTFNSFSILSHPTWMRLRGDENQLYEFNLSKLGIKFYYSFPEHLVILINFLLLISRFNVSLPCPSFAKCVRAIWLARGLHGCWEALTVAEEWGAGCRAEEEGWGHFTERWLSPPFCLWVLSCPRMRTYKYVIGWILMSEMGSKWK